jgi:hypothetical protein
VFLVVALALVGSTLLAARLESLAGLVLIGLGLPVYWFLRREGRRAGLRWGGRTKNLSS